jgi:hypothetical protein
MNNKNLKTLHELGKEYLGKLAEHEQLRRDVEETIAAFGPDHRHLHSDIDHAVYKAKSVLRDKERESRDVLEGKLSEFHKLLKVKIGIFNENHTSRQPVTKALSEYGYTPIDQTILYQLKSADELRRSQASQKVNTDFNHGDIATIKFPGLFRHLADIYGKGNDLDSLKIDYDTDVIYHNNELGYHVVVRFSLGQGYSIRYFGYPPLEDSHGPVFKILHRSELLQHLEALGEVDAHQRIKTACIEDHIATLNLSLAHLDLVRYIGFKAPSVQIHEYGVLNHGMLDALARQAATGRFIEVYRIVARNRNRKIFSTVCVMAEKYNIRYNHNVLQEDIMDSVRVGVISTL